jgi:hypothetical protein
MTAVKRPPMFGPTACFDLSKWEPRAGKCRVTVEFVATVLASKISAETLAANTWTYLLLKPSEGAVK